LYDAEPFCTYHLAGTEGEVDYGFHKRVSIQGHRFDDVAHLERALLRMLLAVAKHVRRFITVVPADAGMFLPGELKFASPRAKSLCPSMKDAFDAPGLPRGVVLSVAKVLPENFGRLIIGWNYEYGAALFAPQMLSAVEVVPVPWKHGSAPVLERLPPPD
jgi:hypothetical protein